MVQLCFVGVDNVITKKELITLLKNSKWIGFNIYRVNIRSLIIYSNKDRHESVTIGTSRLVEYV